MQQPGTALSSAILLRDGEPHIALDAAWNGQDALHRFAMQAWLRVSDLVAEWTGLLDGYAEGFRFDVGTVLLEDIRTFPALSGGTLVQFGWAVGGQDLRYEFKGWVLSDRPLADATIPTWRWELGGVWRDGVRVRPGDPGPPPNSPAGSSPRYELPESRRILAELAASLGCSVPTLLQALDVAARPYPGAPAIRGTAVLPEGCTLEISNLAGHNPHHRIELQLVVRGRHFPQICRFEGAWMQDNTVRWKLETVGMVGVGDQRPASQQIVQHDPWAIQKRGIDLD